MMFYTSLGFNYNPRGVALTPTVYKAFRNFNVTSQIKSLIVKTRSVDGHKGGFLILKKVYLAMPYLTQLYVCC